MHKLIFQILLAMSAFAFLTSPVQAEPATKEEAMSLVRKAATYIKEQGKEKAFAEFSNPKGKFLDRELYVVAIDMNGYILAHGANAKMIGKQLLDVRDLDGKYFTREEVELAKTKGKGWVNFRWNNPVTGKIEPRSVYLESQGNYFILSGVFNQ